MRPAVFPLLELSGFLLAISAEGPLAAALWLGPAALALSLTVHLVVHEWLHQGHPFGIAGEFLASSLIGMPFDAYRWHHWNHHRHENGLEDYSSTWVGTPEDPRPRSLLAYALLWPAQAQRSRRDFRRLDGAGSLPPGIAARVHRQKRFLQLLLLGLALASPWAAFLYLALVYLGWALIGVHNYGQHLPVDYHGPRTTSFRARGYNAWLLNNGLHAEHHADPSIPWDRLEPGNQGRDLRWPHPLAAFLEAPR